MRGRLGEGVRQCSSKFDASAHSPITAQLSIVGWAGGGVFSIKLLGSLNVSHEVRKISLSSPVADTG